jgi:hypothetical protein
MFYYPFAVLGVVLFTSTAPAGKKTIEFAVEAGEHARANEPVTVPLVLPVEFEKIHTVILRTGKDTREIVGQLTPPGLDAEVKTPSDKQIARELHFILPSLMARGAVTFEAVLDTDNPDVKLDKDKLFNWTDATGPAPTLNFGSTPVLRYMYKDLDTSSAQKREETFKVFHHLFDPAGKRLVTKGPPGGLYPHHQGIFYGFREVVYDGNKKVDIWHCPEAYQAQERFLETEAGPVLGRQRVLVAWHGKGTDVFAREEREMTVYHVAGGTLLQFVSRLKTTGGPVKLDGDPQHSGFHFRAAQEVADKTKAETIYIRPDGVGKPGETRNWDKDHTDHKNLPWDAMSFVLGGQRYTVAYLDLPTNPKEARYSERDYGRFGSYFVTEVTEAKPLTVKYRLWLQEGQMTVEDVAALSNAFVAPVKITVK